MTTLDKLKQFAEWMNTGQLTKDIEPHQVFSYGSCITKALMSQFSVNRGESHVTKTLRASQLGKPAVLQAMDALNLPKKGETVLNKLRQIFFMGDAYECLILVILELYGFKVSRLQEEIEFVGIKGHIDAVLDDDLVIEIKTMSSQYANKFSKQPDDSRGYVTQLTIYQDVLGLPGAWVTFDKGSSTTRVIPYPSDETTKSLALDRARKIIETIPKVKTFEDVYNLFDPPEPSVYICKRKPTELFTVPETMQYSLWRYVFYKIETQKDCYNKPREFVIDYNSLEEAQQALNELINS